MNHTMLLLSSIGKTATLRAVLVAVFMLMLALLPAFTPQAEAQLYQRVSNQLLTSVSGQNSAVANMLQSNISVSFRSTPVLEALEKVAKETGLQLNYNRSDIDTKQLVTGTYQQRSLEYVLDAVTSQSGLFYYVTESGQLVLLTAELPDTTGTLTGSIRDAETGEPLTGATIFIEGLNVGRAADIDGTFELANLPEGSYTARISFIGYQTKRREVTVTAGETRELHFQLTQDVAFLDDVVVTGYSVRQRSTPTGALSRIEGADIQQSLIQSPDQALQGRMTGVQVSHTSGQPGSGLLIRVRGRGSINASNSPIYIVDGVQVRTDFTSVVVEDNALTGINPNDIESIEVLKDASATALYGAQGANGVVLITTRQARRGQTQINISSQVGFNAQPEKIDVMDGPTWTDVMIQGFVNREVDRGRDEEQARQQAIDRFGDPATAPTYDWQDAISRSGALHNYSISASAGFDNTRIFLSGSYDFEQGAVNGSDFSTLRFRSNIDHSFNDRFTLATRLSASTSEANGVRTGSANILSPFHGGITQRPIDAIFTEDGDYNHNDIIRVNLVHLLDVNTREATTRQLRGSLTGIYRIQDNISFRSLWGVDYRTVRDRSYTSPLLPRYAATGGSLTERFRETVAFNTNQLIEYFQNFDEHDITVVAGVEYRENQYQSFAAAGEMFPNPLFQQLDLAAIESSISGRTTESKNAGAFTRVDYSYMQRYFVSGNMRYDGSSRFGENNRWGLFYSGALAWDIAQESFMERFTFIDQLKLRTSYGITGNSGISDFASRSLFGSGGTYEGATGLRPSGLGNDVLTWEEAETLDLGFELSLFEGRVFADVNRYRTNNRNLLLNAFLPTDSGFSSIARNAGVVRNTGWEIELGGRVINARDFNWTSAFNITFQENEVIELVDGLDILGSSVRVGFPLDIIWGNKFIGINPADGRVMWEDEDGHVTYRRTSADQQQIGSFSPDFFGGFVNTFRYRNFQLYTFFQYEHGRDAFNQTIGRRMHSVSSERGLHARVARDAWQQPGDMTYLPRHYNSSAFPGSSSHNTNSVYINDASYIRLKEVRLDYQVPSQFLERVSLSRANVFVQGRNLLTWTNYMFGDPEFVGQGTGVYPQSRQITAGVNLQF
ncbi:TonB-linked outer membrane protein, SusC/RagA family [Cyclonatronum proteinivorum]|uniref:TonB-linked outer membrane protein, SusC/RagA family n=2 Tax=Cyclonatronum proteinivorum TaxID=1457365 RepID=A0A345UN23_9BACT|nr:TonB-linked outer membrane protein, SusC/RagA family [Cyclonatronum proteinivorum]